jgi:CheY-like chemotaxis protein
MTVLLVDDDSYFRTAIKRILRENGFEVIEAHNGIDAYKIVQEIGANLSLLLTDLSMPGMDGHKLAQSTTLLYPRLPVVLMTGNYLDPQNSVGGYLVLHKPIRSQTLIQAIRQSISAAAVES